MVLLQVLVKVQVQVQVHHLGCLKSPIRVILFYRKEQNYANTLESACGAEVLIAFVFK